MACTLLLLLPSCTGDVIRTRAHTPRRLMLAHSWLGTCVSNSLPSFQDWCLVSDLWPPCRGAERKEDGTTGPLECCVIPLVKVFLLHGDVGDDWSLSSQDHGNFRPHRTNKSAIISLLKLGCPGVILIPPRLTCSLLCNFWLAPIASVLQGP